MDEQPGLRLRRVHDYAFDVEFDVGGKIQVDEAEPLGASEGPNPSRMLLAAVAHCLSSSLLFCMQKSRVEVDDVQTRATARLARNEEGRWRIEGLDVHIGISADPEQQKKLERCKELFEDFCIVTQSIRQGIPVNVEVASG